MRSADKNVFSVFFYRQGKLLKKPAVSTVIIQGSLHYGSCILIFSGYIFIILCNIRIISIQSKKIIVLVITCRNSVTAGSYHYFSRTAVDQTGFYFGKISSVAFRQFMGLRPALISFIYRIFRRNNMINDSGSDVT